MYPYGSGMPSAPPQNNPSMYPQNMPFGAGFQVPQNQASYPSSQQSSYQQQTPYPSHQSNYPSNSPYPPSQSPYPQTQCAYPPQASGGGSYPHTPFGVGFQSTVGQQPGYPPQQASYPQYPSGGHQQTAYGQTAPYPPSSTNMPSYPSANQHSAPNNSYPYGQTQGQQSTPYRHETIAVQQCYAQTRSSIHGGVQPNSQKGTPTVIPDPDFDPVKDAHALRKAMKGFGTDEDALINIICRRTNEQRQEIQRQFKTHFGKELIEDIKSETSGNFENLLVSLLRPIVEFYVVELCDAMSGLGTDEDVLIETLCTLANAEIHTIKNAYIRIYGRHLEAELKSETSGNFKRLLVSLCNANRDESGHADPAGAQNDARELLRAGELRVGTDESMFNAILCQRNYQQLKLVFDEYKNLTGHTLEKAIKTEFSGDIKDGLLAIYKCVSNKAEFFAERLHKSMAGLGTNDKQLIRIIVTRSEIDLQDIKVTFEKMYGKSLKSWIKGDTSGHYKHALYALIGEERSG